MKTTFFYTCLLLIAGLALPAAAQTEKEPLNHSVYDDWKSLSGQQISNDGQYVSYEINPQKGDGWLYIKNLETNELDSMERGTDAVFAPHTNYLAYRVTPPEEAVRQAKVDEKDEEKFPNDHLEIRLLPEGDIIRIENIQSFHVPEEETSCMLYHLEKDPESEEEGARLVLFNPVTEEEDTFENVVDYTMSKNGKAFLIHHSEKGEEGEDEEDEEDKEDEEKYERIQMFNTDSRFGQTIFEGSGQIEQISIDDEGIRAAFLYAEEEEPPVYDLHLWQEGDDLSSVTVSADTPGVPGGWSPSAYASPSFPEDGDKLFFGTAPIPKAEPEDTLLDEEKYRVDIWHYEDPLIQPMQKVQKEEEKKRTYTAAWHLDEEKMVQLADSVMPNVTTNQYGDGSIEMGYSMEPYKIPNSFESGKYRDVYLVDVNTGERSLVLEKHRGSVHRSTTGDPRLSPDGNFLLHYNQEEHHWYAMSTDNHESVKITGDIPYPLYDVLHDTPAEPGPHGVAGWIEDDSYVLIYDRFDIWRVDPTGEDEAAPLTDGFGRDNNIRLRYVDLDPETESIGLRDNIMLSAFDIYTKQSGFYHARANRSRDPQRLVMDDVRYYRPEKARDANVMIWRKSTFEHYPDLWVSDISFADAERISDTNPQQDEYLWGTVELVEWKSFANDSLQGLLYLPETFDPEKSYPMLVYFYERSSDGLHSHFVPTPSWSTINRSFYVSNDYIIFVPDIPYTVGYPGQSAYDAIVSGTKAMVNQFDFIDRENIGLQGQSWAGYQIAWLITRTDMYKAAMAGAPVSNMFSAYGGIRWSTGMSRIYQYEETQSRIGGTIWDETLRYIENSPIFHADRINTPLLMMHNDDDGAVPWYQGIELYMGMRRLGKPVWMLSYNDEAHNLRRRPNRMDLSIRMHQFFEHYLRDEPAPRWMEDGIPAVKKGVEDGYELVK